MCAVVPEERKIRTFRQIMVLWVKRPGEGRQRIWFPHTAYVFELPLATAQDDQAVMSLRAGCDVPNVPVEKWQFVNCRMVDWYTCGSRLRQTEVGLLIRTRWRLTHPRIPLSAFWIDSNEFSRK